MTRLQLMIIAGLACAGAVAQGSRAEVVHQAPVEELVAPKPPIVASTYPVSASPWSGVHGVLRRA